jgi:hypothetical protein
VPEGIRELRLRFRVDCQCHLQAPLVQAVVYGGLDEELVGRRIVYQPRGAEDDLAVGDLGHRPVHRHVRAALHATELPARRQVDPALDVQELQQRSGTDPADRGCDRRREMVVAEGYGRLAPEGQDGVWHSRPGGSRNADQDQRGPGHMPPPERGWRSASSPPATETNHLPVPRYLAATSRMSADVSSSVFSTEILSQSRGRPSM